MLQILLRSNKTMYDILQLKSKSLEELQVIAAEMGLKSSKSTDKNTLVYDILDEQAISASKNTTERERKPKNRIARKDNLGRGVFSCLAYYFSKSDLTIDTVVIIFPKSLI